MAHLPKYQKRLKDFEKSVKKTANAIGSAIVKTVKAVQFNIGGGLGIGFETQLKIKRAMVTGTVAQNVSLLARYVSIKTS